MGGALLLNMLEKLIGPSTFRPLHSKQASRDSLANDVAAWQQPTTDWSD